MPESSARRPRSWTVGLAVVGSAVTFLLAFPPFFLWPLIFFSPALLAWAALRCAPGWRFAVLVGVVQFALWMWIDRWVIPVTAVGYPLLSMTIAMTYVLLGWILARVARHPHLSRLPMAIVLPIVWVGVEFLRGRVLFHGYAWWFIGHPLIDAPWFVQSADLLGQPFVSFLVAMVGGAMLDELRAFGEARSMRRAGLITAGVVIVIGANLWYGSRRTDQLDSISEGPTILVIQTNLPQDNKMGWPPAQQVEDVESFVVQTIDAYQPAAQAGAEIDLIVWPETMLPGFGLEQETLDVLLQHGAHPGDQFASWVRDLSRHLGTPIMLGSPVYTGLRLEDKRWAWDQHFNSVYLVEGEPPYKRYDKVVLTPFGEVMPYISAWPWLEQKLLAIGAAGMSFSLDAADRIERIALETQVGSVTLVTPICFEDTVARHCRAMVYEGGEKVGDVLVNLSNDGWFSFDDAGRMQHVQCARFRCIENRVPMVRSVNTGFSVGIDSAGRIETAIGAGMYGEARQTGAMITSVSLDGRRSVYGRIGDVWGWGCLVSAGLMLAGTFGRSKPARTDQESIEKDFMP